MIVGRDVGFSIRTIQLGAASSMASISGVYSDNSIFVASAPVLLLLPSSSPPSPSSSPSSSSCPACTSSSAAAAAAPLSSVTGQEASGSGSSD